MGDEIFTDAIIESIQGMTKFYGEIFLVAEATARVDPDLAPHSRTIATIVTQAAVKLDTDRIKHDNESE
ncbi:hypothetical protein J7S19_01640 [Corynebacterium pyruviciproducens]|uniref:hypothetical protein n=1 Tax=Corynebacterium pyruviciproducens TaxID=598660 RepID=UPI00245392B8|nr:hypothetical protein [Corynebacterium pyruviciproducens]MDH4657331.1 hypothetical protein [Corynebacterium pyruviciproducens]